MIEGSHPLLLKFDQRFVIVDIVVTKLTIGGPIGSRRKRFVVVENVSPRNNFHSSQLVLFMIFQPSQTFLFYKI